MLNLASAISGSQVSFASSNDDRRPPESIIDGNPDTCWMTTGLFPQEVVITLPSTTTISSVLIKSCNVHRVSIETSDSSEPREFEKITEKVFKSQDGHLQTEELKFDKPVSAQHLKLIILQGFEHFVFVYSVSVNGTPVHQ